MLSKQKAEKAEKKRNFFLRADGRSRTEESSGSGEALSGLRRGQARVRADTNSRGRTLVGVRTRIDESTFAQNPSHWLPCQRQDDQIAQCTRAFAMTFHP